MNSDSEYQHVRTKVQFPNPNWQCWQFKYAFHKCYTLPDWPFEHDPSPGDSSGMLYQEFNEALLDAIDYAFSSLGESCWRALYFHLKTTFRLPRRQIPERLDEFDEALKTIFQRGAGFLEKLILRKLCEMLGVCDVEDYVPDFVVSISMISARNTLMDELRILSLKWAGTVRVIQPRRRKRLTKKRHSCVRKSYRPFPIILRPAQSICRPFSFHQNSLVRTLVFPENTVSSILCPNSQACGIVDGNVWSSRIHL